MNRRKNSVNSRVNMLKTCAIIPAGDTVRAHCPGPGVCFEEPGGHDRVFVYTVAAPLNLVPRFVALVCKAEPKILLFFFL